MWGWTVVRLCSGNIANELLDSQVESALTYLLIRERELLMSTSRSYCLQTYDYSLFLFSHAMRINSHQ